ncbi:site-2 protease family protein [Humibacter ginsenosidimutans]|nr:site-2 protease family protein [Humibacter ginsenosidimutans]
MSGDRVVSATTARPSRPRSQLSSAIQGSAGETVPMVVERDGEDVTLNVTPRRTETQGDRRLARRRPSRGDDRHHPPTTQFEPQSLGTAFSVTGEQPDRSPGWWPINCRSAWWGVWNAAFGSSERSASSPVGIIGVGRMAGEIADSNAYAFASKIQLVLSLLASLNLALFVFNMIPLLPLDGGHIAGAAWEWMKRGWFKLTCRGTRRRSRSTWQGSCRSRTR